MQQYLYAQITGEAFDTIQDIELEISRLLIERGFDLTKLITKERDIFSNCYFYSQRASGLKSTKPLIKHEIGMRNI